MNPGIYGFQNATLLDPIGSMSKNLAGAVNPVRTPLHFPLSTNWNVNGNNIVLTYDTRLSFTRSAYGTVQTPSTTIYIPLSLTINVHRAIIDWGDGSFDVYQDRNTAIVSHTYSTHGIYTVQIISNSIAGYGSSANLPDARPLRSVSSFGSMSNTSLGYAFFEAVNLNSVPSILPTGITSLSTCFRASNINDPNISRWDVSNVTNMNQTFFQATSFNQPLSGWNTSKVTNMQNMFNACTAFQGQGLENWNVSGVTVMSDMFSNCINFNANLGSWDVRSLTTAPTMFNGAVQFIGSGLSNWQPRLAGTAQNMFVSCTRFGSGISLNLSNWNVTGVTSFLGMFNGCSSLTNLTISGWRGANGCSHQSQFQNANISGSYLPNWTFSSGNVCNSMFNGCNMTNVSGLETWNTSGITSMNSMFLDAPTFNLNIGSWNTSNVTDMSSMFSRNTIVVSGFNNGNSPSISGWNTSKVTNMSYMFANNRAFNQPIGSWDVSKVTNMLSIFQNASDFDQNLSGWNLAGLNSSTALNFFFLNKSISSSNYDALLIGWNNNKSSGVNGIANWRTDLSPNFGSSKYTIAGSGARAALVSYGWTITDGGLQT